MCHLHVVLSLCFAPFPIKQLFPLMQQKNLVIYTAILKKGQKNSSLNSSPYDSYGCISQCVIWYDLLVPYVLSSGLFI